MVEGDENTPKMGNNQKDLGRSPSKPNITNFEVIVVGIGDLKEFSDLLGTRGLLVLREKNHHTYFPNERSGWLKMTGMWECDGNTIRIQTDMGNIFIFRICERGVT